MSKPLIINLPVSARFGLLASRSGLRLPLVVRHTPDGFVIGTERGNLLYSRESEEVFQSENIAARALSTGEWTQRHPE